MKLENVRIWKCDGWLSNGCKEYDRLLTDSFLDKTGRLGFLNIIRAISKRCVVDSIRIEIL